MTGTERVTTWSASDVIGLVRRSFATESVAWIASGHWSDCFAFQHDGKDLVIRIGRHVEDFRKDLIASHFASSHLPIPAVLEVGEAGDCYFAVSERVPGVPLEQAPNWTELIAPIADLFEALQAVDVSALTGWGRWNSDGRAEASSWSEFLLQVNEDPPESRVHGWRQRMTTSPSNMHAFQHWYEQLRTNPVATVPRSLVHNDLFNRNAHVSGATIAGVFDWGNSMVGDHLYDLALLHFWQPWLPQVQDQMMIDTLRRRWSVGDIVTDFAPRFRACLLHIGLEHMAYHSFLQAFDEVELVAQRITTVIAMDWR